MLSGITGAGIALQVISTNLAHLARMEAAAERIIELARAGDPRRSAAIANAAALALDAAAVAGTTPDLNATVAANAGIFRAEVVEHFEQATEMMTEIESVRGVLTGVGLADDVRALVAADPKVAEVLARMAESMRPAVSLAFSLAGKTAPIDDARTTLPAYRDADTYELMHGLDIEMPNSLEQLPDEMRHMLLGEAPRDTTARGFLSLADTSDPTPDFVSYTYRSEADRKSLNDALSPAGHVLKNSFELSGRDDTYEWSYSSQDAFTLEGGRHRGSQQGFDMITANDVVSMRKTAFVDEATGASRGASYDLRIGFNQRVVGGDPQPGGEEWRVTINVDDAGKVVQFELYEVHGLPGTRMTSLLVEAGETGRGVVME